MKFAVKYAHACIYQLAIIEADNRQEAKVKFRYNYGAYPIRSIKVYCEDQD